jgi:outer membrane protein OmpA-like peptidoglycan-associated protein
MTAKSNKEVAMVKKIDNVYLLSANLKASGAIFPGSAQPIHDRFITVEDQAGVKQETSRQLYMTDRHGVICSFDTGKNVKTEDAALKQGFSLASGVVLDASVKPKIYIPPMHLVKYSFAAYGYEKWITEFHASIDTIVTGNDDSVSEMSLQEVNAKTAFSSEEYDQWKKYRGKDYDGDTIKALVMGRSRAVIITFSDKGYEDATVTIKNRKGESVFFSGLEALGGNKAGSTEAAEKREVVVKKPKHEAQKNTIYCATFFDVTNQFQSTADVQDQMYQITVTASRENLGISPGPDGSDELRYTIVERLRFPIKSFAGEFDIINGDAISMEESLLRQFPQRYPDVLKGLQSTQSQDQPMAGIESLGHAVKTHNGKIKLVADVVSADTRFSFMKTLGLGIYGSIEGEKPGFLRTRESINLAFGVFDAVGAIDGALDKFVDYHVNNADLTARARIAASVSDFATRINSLDGGGGSSSPVGLPASLKEAYKSIQPVAGKVVKGMELYSAFNDIGGAYVGFKDLDTAIGNTGAVFENYAHKVFVEDIAIEEDSANPKAKPSVEETQDEHAALAKFQADNAQTAHSTRVGDAYFLNVTFAFDRAAFAPDSTFDDLIVLLKSVKGDYQITLVGHTDNKGSEKYNEILSVKRALSVERVLAENGIGSDQAINIKIEGRGFSEPVASNDSDENRRKNRRVDAIIILHTSKQYKPSREGMVHLEKFRALSTIQMAGVDEKVGQALLSSIDLVAGLPPLNPAHAAFSLAWTVVRASSGLLSDGFDLLQKHIYGDAFLTVLRDFKNNDDLSRANQTLLLEGLEPSDVIKPAYYLESQMRLRSEALSGLMQLLLRCSAEEGDFSDRSKFDFDNVMDGRTTFTYKANLEHYRVAEYVERYVLNDGWVIPNVGFSTLALDEYWLFLIKTNLLEEKVDSSERDWAWRDMADEVYEASKTALASFDLAKDEYIDVASNLISTTQFVYHNAKTLMTPEKEYLFKANFQKYFPIHYSVEDSLEEFCKIAKPDFSLLDSKIYSGITYSVREGGSSGDEGWTSIPNWLETKRRWISPLDQIRVCLLLDSNDSNVKKYIASGTITRIPYSVWPVRVDICDMKGPSMDGFISKIDVNKLTEDEKSLLQGDEDEVYGAIVYPIFKFGESIHRGTKPMADQYSAWLNVNAEHELRSLYNLDRVWSMEYGYQVMLGYNNETLHTISYNKENSDKDEIEKFEDFPYAICSSDNKEIPYSGEENFLDRHFLQVGSGTEDYPPLFKNPEAFCFINPDADSDTPTNYHFPDRNWFGEKTSEGKPFFNNRDLSLPSFKWDSPVELLVLVVSDELDTEAYDKRKRKKDIRSVPARIQLMRKGMNIGENGTVMGRGEGMERMKETEGPEYSASLTPFGHIVKDDLVGLKFELDKASSNIPAYNDLEEQLKNPLVLARLSGMSVEVGEDESEDEDKWDVTKWLEKKKDEYFGEKDKKPVYIATTRLSYQNIVGGNKNGIKPFSADALDTNINLTWGWDFFVKVSSQGESGLSNSTAQGIFNLPYPVGLKDKNSHWYEISDEDKATASAIVETNKKIVEKYAIEEAERKVKLPLEGTPEETNGDHIGRRPPIHPKTPAMIWLAKESAGKDLSDEQKDLVINWLIKEGKKVTLSYMDLKAFK